MAAKCVKCKMRRWIRVWDSKTILVKRVEIPPGGFIEVFVEA